MKPDDEAIGSEVEATDSLPAIVVTRYKIHPHPQHTEVRYRAQFKGGPHGGKFVEGSRCPEDAIGKLIREVAQSLASNLAVVEFIASLFADLSIRSTEVAIARAVWIACSKKNRTAPGLVIETGRAVKPYPVQQERPAKRERYSSS
jgi:hypothetical protein